MGLVDFVAALDAGDVSSAPIMTTAGPMTRQQVRSTNAYHRRTLTTLKETEPQMLCMLADAAGGQVEREDLLLIWYWICAQPKYRAMM